MGQDGLLLAEWRLTVCRGRGQASSPVFWGVQWHTVGGGLGGGCSPGSGVSACLQGTQPEMAARELEAQSLGPSPDPLLAAASPAGPVCLGRRVPGCRPPGPAWGDSWAQRPAGYLAATQPASPFPVTPTPACGLGIHFRRCPSSLSRSTAPALPLSGTFSSPPRLPYSV